MGAGKTTVGRKLAGLLCYEFIDTDQALEARTGVSISHIFEIEGETGFREREAKVLAEVGAKTASVVSTGGGIVLRASNRTVMRNSGTVIYLRASAELLWSRLKDSHPRPLLNVPDPKSKIAQLLEARAPLYTAEADFVVDVCATSTAKIAREIHALLRPHENSQS